MPVAAESGDTRWTCFTAQRQVDALWRPLPVAPIGRALVGARGLERVSTTDPLRFSPLRVFGLAPPPRAHAA